MKIRFIFPFLIILFLFIAPVSGSLNKIASNAPVFVGETDVDISSSLNGCHGIAWWPQGADITKEPAGANLTISQINTVSQRNFHFNFSPDIFSGHTGTWYCQDKEPFFPVFDVRQPENNISILNLDTNEDITGQSVFFITKLTYRIDTNMFPALQHVNRPNYNPSDSFFTVTVTDPRGRSITNYYTGSAGNANTQIIPLDIHPLISGPTYYEPNMQSWDKNARNIQGDSLYPPGTYTVTLTQNLNNMDRIYAGSAFDTPGTLMSTATFTLFKPVTPTPATTTTTISSLPSTSIPATLQTVPATLDPATQAPTTTLIKKVTYSPVLAGIALLGILIAGIFMIRRIRR